MSQSDKSSAGWQVVRDGPSLPMLQSPSGRIFRIQELGAQGRQWGSPLDDETLSAMFAERLSSITKAAGESAVAQAPGMDSGLKASRVKQAGPGDNADVGKARVTPSADQRIRDEALEEAAQIALRRTAIPRDARNPTRDQVVIVGEHIAQLIRERKGVTHSHERRIDPSGGAPVFPFDLADRIERAIDPEHCNYGPAHDSVPGIIVNLKASEWRGVIRALRGAQSATPSVFPPLEMVEWLQRWWKSDAAWRNAQRAMLGPDVAQLMRGVADMIEGGNDAA